MSNVNIVSIIDLPYGQIVRKTFKELEEAGLPSAFSALSINIIIFSLQVQS
jgi:hypothetical protein